MKKNDLVNRYVRLQGEKGSSKVEIAKNLTKICGDPSKPNKSNEIWRLENAERKPSPCKQWVMLNATLDETLAEFGYTRPRPLSSVKWVELIQALLPPKKK